MKYIKEYNSYNHTIPYNEKIMWIINGRLINIIKVLEKLVNGNNDEYYYRMQHLIDFLVQNQQDFSNISGMIIRTSSDGYYTPNIYYTPFENDVIKQNVIDTFISYDYTFKGELKIVDNELVLDTIETDIKKYNL